MGLQAWLMLGLLVGLFALLLKTKIPPWVLFLGTSTLTMTIGLAPEDAAPGTIEPSGRIAPPAHLRCTRFRAHDGASCGEMAESG